MVDASLVKIALIWMSLEFTDDQSTLVQVMAWCRQETSHCLSQCWPKSLSPYGVTRPQWVKCHYQSCLSNPIFSNFGLCAVLWAYFMCHHKLWPTSVSHPFSFLTSSLCPEENITRNSLSLSLDFAPLSCFPYILAYLIISPTLLWLGCYCNM